MTTKTQCELILTHLKKGLPLTAMDALNKFGCFRLASRINDLRNDGHNIMTTMVEIEGNGEIKRVAKYWLVKGKKCHTQ